MCMALEYVYTTHVHGIVFCVLKGCCAMPRSRRMRKDAGGKECASRFSSGEAKIELRDARMFKIEIVRGLGENRSKHRMCAVNGRVPRCDQEKKKK